MSGKSALPLLAIAGIAAFAMKKKKKKSETSGGKIEFPSWTQVGGGDIPGVETGPDGISKLTFDESCQAFADKLNLDTHNAYITGMFHTLVKAGANTAQQIALTMLADQAPHCPWNNPEQYTALMKGVYNQLLTAVSEYANQVGVKLSA